MSREPAMEMALGHHMAGRLPEAEEIYRRILREQPGHVDALNLLGALLGQRGDYDEAIEMGRRAIAIHPGSAVLYCNLGETYRRAGRKEEAIAAMSRGIQIEPGMAEGHLNLGVVLIEGGRLGEAIAALTRAVGIKPEYAEAHFNLGVALAHASRPEEAIGHFWKAIEIRGNYAAAYSNLGAAQAERGNLDEALACFRKAMEIDPEMATAHSNVLYLLNFHAGYDPRVILEEARRWSEHYAEPLAKEIRGHGNDRTMNRRLKIGYVSPDLRNHAIACFVLPLLANHDGEGFEIFCYSGTSRPDEITGRLRGFSHHWRETAGVADEELAQRIRSDGIDILVDLALHMEGGRLLVFARKPAPVQATWLGYPGTTGLRAMDYRLTDRYLDPPGEGDEFYVEKSVRLARSFFCYQPLVETAAPNELPARRRGNVTFGCFNNFQKVTEEALKMWAEVLRATAGSRMRILSPAGSHRQGVVRVFEQAGIDGDRIEFVGKQSSADYFRLYHGVDLCLDPYPYPGHTSTLDGLWMGVAVVTRRGKTAASRGGVSILSNMGLGEFIARDVDEYVAIATGMAHDLGKLGDLRGTLRERLRGSILMDGKGFARDMEAAYREMWRSWCGKG